MSTFGLSKPDTRWAGGVKDTVHGQVNRRPSTELLLEASLTAVDAYASQCA